MCKIMTASIGHEELMKLREQFEQDKERIARMRADRKFKPAGY